jgi:imidazolonepropionase-like amidohydrolase
MKSIRYFLQLFVLTFCFYGVAKAQDDIYPTNAHKGTLIIKNAVIHVGNGQIIDGGNVVIKDGKIVSVGKEIPSAASESKVIDASGKHLYPGLILSNSNLGLVEVNSVRATADAVEIGELNSSVRSIVAYNTDSKVINTLRSNGILLANVVPGGGLISGSSSVVQLDAWNWEDAIYQQDGGIHVNIPRLMSRPSFSPFFAAQQSGDAVKRGLEEVEKIKAFFRDAKTYALLPAPKEANLKLQAVQGLFSKKQKLFVHCDIVKEILVGIDLAKEFGFDVVLVGASESYQIADLIKANNIPVILDQMHSLPTATDDAVDQPYKTPYQLQKAGVLFAINDGDGQHRGRNLPFNAGTAVAYGLTKEEALSSITLNPARILGISDKTGSIEVGKDANLVISMGDILDMKTSIITNAFILGREINLTDKHKQLYERYKYKYDLK